MERDPQTIHAHLQLGALDEEFLRNALTMKVSASWAGDEVVVQVDITNDNTGHHIPTDSPLRHLILLIDATDADGNRLSQLSGPEIPGWGGVGEPDQGYFAGLPGSVYAKVLQELWTEVSPSGAYWNPTRVISDNRIAAFETASSTYIFASPVPGTTRVEVTLLFRRAFIQLMDQKGWDVPDIIMAQEVRVLD